MQMFHCLIFWGDEAYSSYLLRPYYRKDLQSGEEIFTYKFSRAGRIVERSFVALGSKWSILFVSLLINDAFSTETNRVDDLD
jgi:hypothetical protein